eukprot:CAMPEP_0174704308 /NCGR_PEP_ID=MMETSP1094-20130205/7951_1 /TAXON_ID=156173 /ORGANISM="Chrysochromulina brevifilum, Strain UTEX LB 985" /LENGTH=256 /DNA_ID=CAMNT_0015902355 /DNA_START=486 /DNA_END=1256 /DNA_ORIENTATION=+
MSFPAAADQLMARAPAASSLRFVVILREPITRAASSARMMVEWKWEKSANVSSALLRDLERLGHCCDVVAPASRAMSDLDGSSGLKATGSLWRRAAAELPRASDRSLRRFRDCLARSNPLNHVRASIYAAAVLGWLSAGFAATQFLWLDTEAMRAMGATSLLRTIGDFMALPTDHLARLPADMSSECQPQRRDESTPGGRPAGKRFVDGRMLVHHQRGLPTATAVQLQAAFRPFNELLRTLLADIAPTLKAVHWLR